MHRKRSTTGWLASAVLALLIVPAAADAFQFRIVANGRLSVRQQGAIEAAVTDQVNTQIARYYTIDPVSFTSSDTAIPIYLVDERQLMRAWGDDPAPAGLEGFHEWAATGPEVYVWGEDYANTAITISHEVIETETDPRGVDHAMEIADPGESTPYCYAGVPVANWITPSHRLFGKASSGCWPPHAHGQGIAPHATARWAGAIARSGR